jgi:hypothetical protein
MEVHKFDLGELFTMFPHVNVSLDKTHVPDFPLEAFQNFELYLVPDASTRRA